ncbi:MAG: hypothetical protein IPO81_07525 [Kouleothrix sp.]|nr:hypothetical protein [Kouleothrix sp.]
MNTLTQIALPVQPLLRSTLARRAAAYAQIEAARTIENWDYAEEQLAAIVMLVPPAQRRSFHALVGEARSSRRAA